MENNFSFIKARFKEIAKNQGINFTELYEIIGMTDGGFKGSAIKRPINSDAIEKIYTKYPHIDLHWLITGKTKNENTSKNAPMQFEDLKKLIPLIPLEVAAGLGSGEIEIKKGDIIESYVIPDFERKGVEYIIKVSGSSMYPKYSNGDLLGCKRITDTTFFQWGKPYVLDTDQGVMVKRLFPVKDNTEALECRSENKENYPPFIISRDSIYSVSIVIGVLRVE